MPACQVVSCVQHTSAKISSAEGSPVDDPTHYRGLAGGLQYTFTRLDISYVVQICLYMYDPANADIHSAKPLLSVTHDKGRSVNSLSAKTSLPSALYRALGKA